MIKIDYKARTIIRQLYKHQKTSIKMKENKRNAATRIGVKKGCKLSQLVFNEYIEQAINECNDIALGLKWKE